MIEMILNYDFNEFIGANFLACRQNIRGEKPNEMNVK